MNGTVVAASSNDAGFGPGTGSSLAKPGDYKEGYMTKDYVTNAQELERSGVATDLFSRFKDEGLNNAEVSKEYRTKILGSAGSKPADEFIEDFLGRPFSTDAYIELLTNL